MTYLNKITGSIFFHMYENAHLYSLHDFLYLHLYSVLVSVNTECFLTWKTVHWQHFNYYQSPGL